MAWPRAAPELPASTVAAAGVVWEVPCSLMAATSRRRDACSSTTRQGEEMARVLALRMPAVAAAARLLLVVTAGVSTAGPAVPPTKGEPVAAADLAAAVVAAS